MILRHIVLLVFITSYFSSKAQLAFFKGIKAQAVTIEVSNHKGSFRDPGFISFTKNARSGGLFDNPGSYVWLGDWKDKTFNVLMDFSMKDSLLNRHGFVVGLSKINQKVTWLYGKNQENISYTARAELMKFLIGYRYYLIHRNRIQLSAGLQMNFGFTVSSFTIENRGYQNFEYFGKKQGQAGLFVPIKLDFRLFRGTFISLGPAYGLERISQDGIAQIILTQGFSTGIRIHI